MAELKLAQDTSRVSAKTVVIAVVVLALIAFALFRFTPRQTAELSIENEQLFAPHIAANATGAQAGMTVLGAAQNAEDVLYVVVDAKLTDDLHLPISISGIAATATLADGSTADALFVDPHQYERLAGVFPDLAPMLVHPLPLDTDFAAKSSTSGTIVLQFPNLTEVAWKAKRNASLTLSFTHQQHMTFPLP